MTTPMVIMKKLKPEDVEFSIECLEEFAQVVGNAMASGDDAVDKKAEDEILAELDAGNLWAWCCVKVTARWKSFTGTDYLGCCSYDNEEDFKQGGYYEDMKVEALADLQKSISEIYDDLQELQVAVVE